MTQSERLEAKWEMIYHGQDLYVGSQHVAAAGYGIRVKKSEKRGYGEEFIVIPSPGNDLDTMRRIVDEHNAAIALQRRTAKA